MVQIIYNLNFKHIFLKIKFNILFIHQLKFQFFKEYNLKDIFQHIFLQDFKLKNIYQYKKYIFFKNYIFNNVQP